MMNETTKAAYIAYANDTDTQLEYRGIGCETWFLHPDHTPHWEIYCEYRIAENPQIKKHKHYDFMMLKLSNPETKFEILCWEDKWSELHNDDFSFDANNQYRVKE